MDHGWAILKNGKPYIHTFFQTQELAMAAYEDLLAPYLAGHEWRRKLRVGFYDHAVATTLGEPPYGYRYLHDHVSGVTQVRDELEQGVLVRIRALIDAGMSCKETAVRLHRQNLKPRHGPRFTGALVTQMLETILELRRQDGRQAD